MVLDIEAIKDAIAADEKLCRLIATVENIAIVEFEGRYTDGCEALLLYLQEQNIESSKVDTIVLMGKRSQSIKDNISRLTKLYSGAKILATGQDWHKTNLRNLLVRNTLVIYMFTTDCQPAKDIDIKDPLSSREAAIISATRCAYYAIIKPTVNLSLFESNYESYTQDRLVDFSPIDDTQEKNEVAQYCENRTAEISSNAFGLPVKEAFFYCLNEAMHGCEVCCRCTEYGREKHCPVAQFQVAEFYRSGVFVTEDQKIAHQWYMMTARQGYRRAALRVAKDMVEGTGCDKDAEGALVIYERYANRGSRLAMKRIIEMVDNGEPIKPMTAVPHLVRLANDGEADMIQRLIKAFKEGRYGLPVDMIQSALWKIQLIRNRRNKSDNQDDEKAKYDKYHTEAEEGNLYAMEELCFGYYDGKNLAQDNAKSAYWGLKALEKGSKRVRFRMAWLLDDAEGVEPDYEKAYNLYVELANEGDSAAMNNIGWMYERGHYVEKDMELAFEWYLKAANKGDAVAQRNVGYCYRDGVGTEKDLDLAIEWYEKAAIQGEIPAMKRLAELYSGSYDGIDNKPEEVEKWYRMAIDSGDEDAMIKLGFAFETGKGVEKDYGKAIVLYKMAADRGLPTGFYNMGTMYHFGKGVEINLTEAEYWYRKALDKGFGLAKDRLLKLGVKIANEDSK